MRYIIPLILLFTLLPFSNTVIADDTPELLIHPLTIPDVHITGYTTITLTEAPHGLSGYNLSITIANDSLATITDITYPSWATLYTNSTLPSPSSWIKVLDLHNTIQPGATNITLLTLTIMSHYVGTTTLNLTIHRLDDDKGHPLNTTIYNTTLVIKLNHPPFAPTNPTPTNGSTNILLSPTLSVHASDPDGNPITITFLNAADHTNIGTPQAIPANTTATITWAGLRYSTTYSWYATAHDTSFLNISNTWTFTTKKKTSSSGSGGGIPPLDMPPIADLSAGEPYTAFDHEIIVFNASKSHDDHTITHYSWDFGDNSTGTGITVEHRYLKPGTYIVTLTIIDNLGQTDTDTTTVTILQPNHPPTPPTLHGPQHGSKNQNITFTIHVNDTNNDDLQLIIIWENNTTTKTEWIPSNTTLNINHSWPTYGIYILSFYTTDTHNTTSPTKYHTLFIDTHYCEHLGYLIDLNSDTIYDHFYSNTSHDVNTVKNKENNYYIDTDNNGTWDYIYSQIHGLSNYSTNNQTPGFGLLILLLALTTFILFSRKKRQ